MSKTASKGLVAPSIIALVGVIVLLSLGTWQMQRRDWKNGLIEQIKTRTSASPISLSQAIDVWQNTKDIDHTRFEAVGTFDHEKERHLFTVEKGVAGWRVFTPLMDTGGNVIFVDRGFAPAPLKNKSERTDGLLAGEVKVIGLAREPATKGFFTLENATEKNEFYWRSLEEMVGSVYSEAPKGLVPFFLEAQTVTPSVGKWPHPQIQRLKVPNKHFSYALTWYGLAGVLLIIYAVYVRARLRENG